MKVISLFDGISCGRVALERIGITLTTYFASEINPSAIRIAKRNYPDTVQLGDVRHVSRLAEAGAFGHIDLLMGGSPCQGFSRAGDGLNFNDPRSALFFEFVRVKNNLKPSWFLFENVDMNSDFRDIISQFLGVQPVAINSRLFSAQNRPRWYWTNIPVAPCVDHGQPLSHVLGTADYVIYQRDKPSKPKADQNKASCLHGAGGHAAGNHSQMDIVCLNGVAPTVNANGRIMFTPLARRYSVIECERLQTLPDDYTSGVANSHRYSALSNGWTVDVIAHILGGMS